MDVRPPPARVEGSGIEYHQGDVRDADLLGRLMAGVDVVHHLASVHLEVHAGEEAFRSVNVEAVRSLVRLAAEAGVRRFVHTSSVGIYGHVRRPPAAEDAPRSPTTAYERTKLAGEEAALEEAAAVGQDLVVVRPAWVYGPGCPRTGKLLRAIGKGRFFYVGSGQNLRHPVYIDDMVEAYRRIADAGPDVAGKAYIIAGPRWVTLRELATACAGALGVSPPRLSIPAPAFHVLALAAEAGSGLVGREPPFSRRSAAFFQNDNAFDTAAARADLGFSPAVDLAEGLQRSLTADASLEPTS